MELITSAVELGVATALSSVVAVGVNAEPLITVLITFGCSLVTVVGAEVIKFLVAFFKKKTEDLSKKKEGDKDDDKSQS